MQPRLLCLFPLFACLLLHHVACSANPVDGSCEPVTCGNLTIKFPFWLSKPYCGHPAFRLSCGGRGALFTDSYIRVLDIHYGNRTFVAVHSLLADGYCPAIFNVSSSLALSLFTNSPSNRALFFLSHCSGAPPPGSAPVTSTACDQNGTYAYLGGSYRKEPKGAPWRCGLFSSLPVLGSEAAGSDASQYNRLIGSGFLLEWDAANIGDCDACAASGGRCRHENSTAFACFCPDGRLSRAACDGEFLIMQIG